MSVDTDPRGGRRSPLLSSFLLGLYGTFRSEGRRASLRSIALRFEGGPIYSLTVRDMLRKHHGVSAGVYSIGPCEAPPQRFRPGTTIGRYCSLYWTARALPRDVPPDHGFSHGLFPPRALGAGRAPAIPTTPLSIGSDVFMGHNVIIMPTVDSIADGVFIGAGSVVHANLPPFAVVTGNPARVVRYRFSEPKIKELLEAKWWEKTTDELSGDLESFIKPFEGDTVR